MMKIKNPAEEQLQIFLSSGLQLGQLLEQLLAYTGPARIVVSTFSTGEEFLVKLHTLRKRGLVTEAICYTDIKAAEKTARNNTMARLAFDQIHLCRNHSKVILISGVEMSVAVLTSQNTTRGNRLESYVILYSAETVRMLADSLAAYKTAKLW